ncbi:FAD-binding oxidoreductase [Shewanella surugensis]|uniref:FAD-dependent oxidoreductase n=1 Tax=Shewanella surugensis TaxID=212020 RepID=A0ABT0LA23_9GAMM|nr:FAD-dependent oxidoreductase [Shewanella surugensis]MCL1124529.1 FAD-dependent oxidoreductase [Shewanella surugensis]
MSLDTLDPLQITFEQNININYQTSGLVDHNKHITGVYKPTNSDDLITKIKECHRNRQAFYAISTGKNWGYGKATPIGDDNLIIDLSQMKEIHHYDAELGVVEVGPGVTQGQLARFLENTPWMIDCTGAGPATSIIGNVLERGFGHGAQGYRSRHFTITEYILANGEKKSLDTTPRYVGRAGHSAGLTEIFTQNNLAVVTKIRFELSLKQKQSLRCLVRLKKVGDIGAYINIMRQLKAENTLDTLPHIGNNYRMLSMVSQFDFSKWDPQQGPLNSELTQLEKQHQIMPWTAAFIVSGAPQVAKAKAKRIKVALNAIADVKIVSLSTLKKVNHYLQQATTLLKFSPRLNHFQQQISQFTRAMIMFEGNPDPMALKGCYWRNQSQAYEESNDPIESQCGFYWIAPALPMLSDEINSCMQQSEQLFQEFGFEFGVTLTSVTAHMCQAIISLYYDIDNANEQQRAKALIRQLRQLYKQNNWQCYRRAVDEMPFPLAEEHNKDALELKHLIKQTLDPYNLINPGRYQAISQPGATPC